MRKILLSILTIAAVSALAIGGTMSFFSDLETSVGNSFTAGTIEIAVDNESRWSQNFEWGDVKPGRDFEISFNITNEGQNPLKLWQISKCMVTDENGIIEPEQAWYDEFNGGLPKNDIDSAIVYEMYVDDNLVVAKDAGITMDKIKDNYIGLVKLDKPFAAGNGDGILYPGESVLVELRYFMKADTENWAQSDTLTFVIELEARQIDAPEPLQQMVFLENKNTGGDWSAIADVQMGILKYDYQAPTFNYSIIASGLVDGGYQLIYYPDPWAANKNIVKLGSVISSLNGELDSGIVNYSLGTDLPDMVDENFPHGAKIWLVPVGNLNGNVLSWTNIDKNLYENWPGLINYRQGDRLDEELICDIENTGGDPAPQPQTITIQIDNPISTSDWTGVERDYSLSDVTFTYNNPGTSGRLGGTINATNLKPRTTYQLKFIGKPTCDDPVNGNDDANEYIGYQGRWTVLNTACSGAACNRSDKQYESDNGECIAGYLVWGFFTTDELGNAGKVVSTDNSYHVLRCNGGTCGLTNDSFLQNTSATPPGYPFCDAAHVGGELEPGRALCDAMTLDSGTYDLKMVLTEESFHQSAYGQWTSVLDQDINFDIE